MIFSLECLGPLQYDVVSLLYQSRAQLPQKVRDTLLDCYLNALFLEPLLKQKQTKDEFIEYYYGFVAVRLLQVLGAYGKLGFRLNKQFFLESFPFAVTNFIQTLEHDSFIYSLPALKELLGNLSERSYIQKGRQYYNVIRE